jgi:hypothetical protein
VLPEAVMARAAADLALLHTAHTTGRLFFPREQQEQQQAVATILNMQKRAGRFF